MSWTIHDPWDRADAPNPIKILLPCWCRAAYARTLANTWLWVGTLCPHCATHGPQWEIVL